MSFINSALKSFSEYSLIWTAIVILLFVTIFSYIRAKIKPPPTEERSPFRVVVIAFIAVIVFFLGGLLFIMFAFRHGV